MKVAFYLDNSKHKNIDYSNPKMGNPGIGGTEYMIWTVSYHLSVTYDDIEIFLLAPEINRMPGEIKCLKVKNMYDSLKVCKENNIDIFVFRGPDYGKALYEQIDNLGIPSIMWDHNFEYFETVEAAAKCKFLKRIVCVGKEQYDRLRDHKVFEKSCYIFNALDFSIYENQYINKANNFNVCYVSSLHRVKGFHALAKVWPKILKRVPEARLIVLGGPNLYDGSEKLGKYNITVPDYEKEFIKYITDKNGELMSSVEFLGVKGGKEKLEIMKNSKVGIPNPTGEGETFCIVAIEFGGLGVPVVSIRKYGLLDTVDDKKSGLLFSNENEFVENVVRLLLDNEENKKLSEYAAENVRKKFSLDRIGEQWHELLMDVFLDKECIPEYNMDNLSNDMKYLREFNRKVKKISFFELPSILYYSYLKDRIHGVIRGGIRRRILKLIRRKHIKSE